MSKYASKGIVVKLDVATVLTAVSQILTVKLPGMKSLDFESTTLDTELFKERDMTGFSEADSFEAEMWFDAELATQAAILEHVNPADPVNDPPTKSTWELTLPDVSATNTGTTIDFDCAGLEISDSLAMDTGIKRSIKGALDGRPIYAINAPA